MSCTVHKASTTKMQMQSSTYSHLFLRHVGCKFSKFSPLPTKEINEFHWACWEITTFRSCLVFTFKLNCPPGFLRPWVHQVYQVSVTYQASFYCCLWHFQCQIIAVHNSDLLSSALGITYYTWFFTCLKLMELNFPASDSIRPQVLHFHCCLILVNFGLNFNFDYFHAFWNHISQYLEHFNPSNVCLIQF